MGEKLAEVCCKSILTIEKAFHQYKYFNAIKFIMIYVHN